MAAALTSLGEELERSVNRRLDACFGQLALLSAAASSDAPRDIADDVRALRAAMVMEAEATAAAQRQCLELEEQLQQLRVEQSVLEDERRLLKQRVATDFASATPGHVAESRQAAVAAAPSIKAVEPAAAGAVSGVLTAADGLEYMVYLPKTWSGAQPTSESPRQYPLLLFLHGRGGVKNPQNIRSQSITKMLLEDDPRLMAHSWYPDDAMGANNVGVTANPEGFPFIVLIPVASQPSWQPQFSSLLSLVALAQSQLYADPKRTYLTGQSMGGNGAWHLAASAPAGVFAAVVPVCGYLEMPPPPKKKKQSNRKKPHENLNGNGPQLHQQTQQQPLIPAPDEQVVDALLQKSIPIWAFHAADDVVVPVGHTDVTIEAVRQQQRAESQSRYTRYETAPPMVLSSGKEMAGHAAWELAYSTMELCASSHCNSTSSRGHS